jgi:hypothetical protein
MALGEDSQWLFDLLPGRRKLDEFFEKNQGFLLGAHEGVKKSNSTSILISILAVALDLLADNESKD